MGATTATFLFTDVVDSTALLTRLGVEAFDRLRIDHDAACSDAESGAPAGRRQVKHTGDGFMAV